MQTVRLSQTTISRLPQGGPRVRDKHLPIIAVPSSTKHRVSLFIVKRFDGYSSARWIKLGVWPDVSWSVARDKALAILAEHANDRTPSAAIDNVEYPLESVGDVLSYALTRIEADKKMSPHRTRNLKGLITRHLKPALGELPIHTLTVDDIYSRLVAPRYEQYNVSYLSLMLRTLRQVFRQVEHRTGRLNLPALNLKTYTSAAIKPKEAAYHVGQVADVMHQIRRERRPWLRVLAAWSLMYGVRVGEVSALSWSEHIDVENRLYRLPESLTKNGKGHRLPLTDTALDVLTLYRRTERARGRRGDHMFPARRNPWRAVNKTYASALVSRMLKRGSCHDLRKLMRSWLQEHCNDTYVGRLILNQKQDALDDIYVQKLLEDKSRAHLESWHARLIESGLFDALGLTRGAQSVKRIES